MQGVTEVVERQTLTERVYQILLKSICSGELAPGEKLVIDTLARRMNVSITPVREALRRLQRENLVTEVPYSGVHVSKLSVDEILELFAIRGVLEGYALRLIAERITTEHLARIRTELEALERVSQSGDTTRFRECNYRFHSTLLEPELGRSLRDMIDQVVRNTERYRAAGAVLSKSYIDAAQAQHRQLVDLLESGRTAEAETLTREHAMTFAMHLAEHLKREPE